MKTIALFTENAETHVVQNQVWGNDAIASAKTRRAAIVVYLEVSWEE